MSKGIYLAVAAVLFFSLCAWAKSARDFSFTPPLGIPLSLWTSKIPSGNPMSQAKIALGKALFFDKRLSINNMVSCATCHDPKFAFTDHKRVATGVYGRKGARNTPSILNAMFSPQQFWDGRAATLEDQAKGPMINPVEMGMPSYHAIVAKLDKIPDYVKQFKNVFGDSTPLISINKVTMAIAAFERTEVSADSPFDRFIAGDANAISPAAKEGWKLFNGKARCIICHAFSASSPFFTDAKYENTGIGMEASKNFGTLAGKILSMAANNQLSTATIDKLSLTPGFSELGRFLVTHQPQDVGAFKTPGLRNVALTPPYMHDGSLKTLKDVIDFYNKGGDPNPNLDGSMSTLNLTPKEENELIAFLNSLTSYSYTRSSSKSFKNIQKLTGWQLIPPESMRISQ